MQYITLKLLFILSLVLSSTISSSLKLPNLSVGNTLIVNHLNYLRYDYLSNPTSLRANGYPFYDSSNLNRLANFNRTNLHQPINRTNDLDLILTGRIDEHLNQQFNNRLNQLNERSITGLNNDLNNNQLEQNEHQSNDYQPNEPHPNDYEATQSTNNLNEDLQLNLSGTDELINHQKNSTNDTAQSSELNQINDLNNNNLNEVNNEFHNLILTSSPEHEQRLLELSLLQQDEPSLSVVLDSPFLNQIKSSDGSSNLKHSLNESEAKQVEVESLGLSTNDSLLNDLFEQENTFAEENLNEILNSPSFNLLNFAASNENSLNLDSTDLPQTFQDNFNSNSDLFLPANIDDLANDLLSSQSIDFLNDGDNFNNSDDNLQSLINNSPLINDFSSVLNQDPCINNQESKLINDLAEEAACSTANNHHQVGTDNYIREYISEEDLQLMCFSNLQTNLTGLEDLVEASGVNNDFSDNLDLASQDRIEVSSDSAISSMSRSDWFDSSSESSSHFDDQFKLKKNRCLKSKNKERLICESKNSNSDGIELLDNFEIDDSNLRLFERDEFDDQLLNLDETSSSRSNQIDFTNHQDLVSNSNLPLQSVLHNHTYTDVKINQNAGKISRSSTVLSTSNDRPQSSSSRISRVNFNALTLESIRTRHQFEDSSSVQSNNFDMISITSETSSMEEERSLSRDEKKAKELQLPFSVCEIINMPIDEFNECLTKYELNEMQLTLIRDIRRRGKNKVAAQNCRKRKLGQIVNLETEVSQLQGQKNDLMSYYNKLFAIKEVAKTKYQKLYDYIAERSLTNAALLANFESLNFRLPRNNSEENGAVGFNHTTKFDENNTNQLNEMPSTGGMKNLTEIKPTEKILANYKKALVMN